MEDKDFKELFNDFEPEMSSDLAFMSRLRDNLDSVEMIRQHNARLHARNRIAIAIAACVGFMVGLMFSLALPYIGSAVNALQSTLPSESVLRIITDNYRLLSWLLIGATTVYATINSDNIALGSLTKDHHSPNR